MAQMLEPKAGEGIYDPTCGTGGMLISCLAEVKRHGGDTRTIGLYGQELINITAGMNSIPTPLLWGWTSALQGSGCAFARGRRLCGPRHTCLRCRNQPP